MTAPTLAAISNVTLVAGAPLNIALDGFDAESDPLSFTAAVTNNVGNVSTFVPQGNDSLRFHVVQKNPQGVVLQDFGVMEFELFEDLAPVTTARIEQLVNQGFYNNLTFHRVISNFVIQGGDPLGTGGGGSGTEFDDEFDVSLRFTSSGILAMAKSSDDTNDSQFFITAAPTRWLDFQHSIFGFLTKGESVRQTINSVPTGANDKPTNPVVIASANIFSDVENGVLRLSAPIGASGTSTVTVTVNDGHGGIATRAFNVTVVADTAANNGHPFLKPVGDINTTVGQTVNKTISAVDAEGNGINFYAEAVSGTGVTFQMPTVNVTPVGMLASTNIAITPAVPGQHDFYFAVRPQGYSGFDQSIIDVEKISVNVTPLAPTAIDLLDSSDDGQSNVDNITSLNNASAAKKLSFKVSGVWQGSSVTLKIGDRVIGTAVAQSAAPGATPVMTDIVITTNGVESFAAGVNSIVAVQSVEGLGSALSTPLRVVVDNHAFGDATGNGKVDGADYVIWSDNFLRANRLGPQQGDFNWDGIVNGVDYIIWSDHFSPVAILAAVPNQEPVAASSWFDQPALASPLPKIDTSDAGGSALDSSSVGRIDAARVSIARHAVTTLIDDLFERFGRDDSNLPIRFLQKWNRGHR